MANRDGNFHVGGGDLIGAVGYLPGLIAEFLEEIRVALGLGHHPPEGFGVPTDPLGFSGFNQRSFGLGGCETVDDPENEQALGVRLGVAGRGDERRQPRGGHHERKLFLADPVESGDQRRQVSFRQVLALVDGEENPDASRLGQLSDLQ